MRKFFVVILTFLAISILSPWFTGIWFERTYRSLIAFYNAKTDVNIEILQYHRGWWKSKAVLYIHFLHPEIRQYFKDLGVQNPGLDITLDQSIEHGPVIIQPESPSRFGLAYIHSLVFLSKDIQKIMQAADENQPIIITNNDLVTFAGNYYKHFAISPFQLMYVKNDLLLKFIQGIRGDLWISPRKNHFQGKVNLQSVIAMSGNNILTSPDFVIQFDQYQSKSGLWLGDSSVITSQINWDNNSQTLLQLFGMNFHGNIGESVGELYGLKVLELDQLNLAGRSLGPIHLKISASGLSVKGLLNVMDAYQKITNRGELYESQLKQKILSLLPAIFSKKSELKIDELEVISPEGNLQLTGKMNWPFNGASSDGFIGIYQDSKAEAKLRVSKKFLNKFLDDISQLPYFRSITQERRNQLLDLQQNMQSANQRNFLFISWLALNGFLTENDAIQLLTLQRNDEPLIKYSELLKKLFLDRVISRELSYKLFWQYVDVKHQVNLFDQALDVDQKIVKQQMEAQVNEWVKDGYITQEKNDYVISVQKDNGLIKLNGKGI